VLSRAYIYTQAWCSWYFATRRDRACCPTKCRRSTLSGRCSFARSPTRCRCTGSRSPSGPSTSLTSTPASSASCRTYGQPTFTFHRHSWGDEVWLGCGEYPVPIHDGSHERVAPSCQTISVVIIIVFCVVV